MLTAVNRRRQAFPGGNFDAKQDNSSEMTAIRETFEETGILLASQRSIASKKTHFELDFEEARKAIHSGKLRFVDFLERNGLNPDTASLLPFSTWVTPPMLEKYESTTVSHDFMFVTDDAQTLPSPILRRLPPFCFCDPCLRSDLRFAPVPSPNSRQAR